MQSLAIDIEANPFLLPEQQQMVERSDALANSFAIRSDGVLEYLCSGESFFELGRTATAYLHDQFRFMGRIRRDLPKNIRTQNDLETVLRFKACDVVTRDRLLTAARTLLALDLGIAFAQEDEEKIKDSTEAGAQLIQAQAGSATQALLIADRNAFRPVAAMEEEISAWDRAKEAFAAHPRIKPPVSIDDKEGQGFDELADRMLDMTDMADSIERPKRSRSRVINLVRAARKSVSIVRHADGMTGTAIVRDVILSPMYPVIPSLGGKETGDAHRTMRRKIRYLQGAARLDPELAHNPIVRNYVYLFDKLGGRDISSVQQLLQRDAKQVKGIVTKQNRIAERQAQVEEIPDDNK